MPKEKQKIEEVIVVEGRDDTNSIKRALDAETIETHGFGISKATWEQLEAAYKRKGLIIFTDPDHAGEQIRRRVLERFPGSKEAFLDRDKAAKNGDIGIENAAPKDILQALEKAKAFSPAGEAADSSAKFSAKDLERAGLSGGRGAQERRKRIGEKLGIGYANSKGFLRKLNGYGITREEFDEAVREKE